MFSRPMRLLPILIMTALFLSACGVKGPLYLPAPAAPSQQPGPLVTPPTGPERPVPAETAPVPR
jgi:hypothetical protein